MTARGAGKAKAVRRTGKAPGKLLFQGNAEQVPFILIGMKDVYAMPGFRSWFDGLTTNGIDGLTRNGLDGLVGESIGNIFAFL